MGGILPENSARQIVALYQTAINPRVVETTKLLRIVDMGIHEPQV